MWACQVYALYVAYDQSYLKAKGISKLGMLNAEIYAFEKYDVDKKPFSRSIGWRRNR
jgi:hypothetical protein